MNGPQAKNKELREFFNKMHKVAVEELKIENEIETRAFILQTDFKTFMEYSKLTDRRYKQNLQWKLRQQTLSVGTLFALLETTA